LSVIQVPGAISPARLAQMAGGKEVGPDGRESYRYKRTAFVNLLNEELLDVAEGKTRSLAVFAPPRHGKTRLLTEVFSAYYLGRFPRRNVIVASHSATLASRFGRNVRDLLIEFGPYFGVKVSEDRRAADNWGLTDGGGMLSIGVGGSLVGFGADLFIFDDIIADSAAALSETVRNNTIDWYESTAETRINAGGAKIFTMQRWHDDDPARRVVFDHAKDWRIINLPAIADHDPANGESDILGRAPGDALWPEKWPIETLREMQSRKSFWFAAQYQQRPVPRGGGMIHREWVEKNVVYARPESSDQRVRFWDRAATEGGGDYTVGVLMSRKGGEFTVEDVVRGQWGSTRRDSIILQTSHEDNLRYPNGIVTWGEQEPGSSGKDMALAFEKMLAPFAAHCKPSTGSKEVRADGMASAFGRGEVHIRKGNAPDFAFDWFEPLLDEMTTFPYAKHDDIVDACSGCYNLLALAVEPGGYAVADASGARDYGLMEEAA
jgi:phage terminase large subunit-like protein